MRWYVPCGMDLPLDKRFTHLSVHLEGHLLHSHIENYFEEALIMNGGISATTKGSQNCHVYGMRSARYVVENAGISLSRLMIIYFSPTT